MLARAWVTFEVAGIATDMVLARQEASVAEGVALVRHLKPADAWLGLRYAYVLFRTLPTLLGLSFVMSSLAALISASRCCPCALSACLK